MRNNRFAPLSIRSNVAVRTMIARWPSVHNGVYRFQKQRASSTNNWFVDVLKFNYYILYNIHLYWILYLYIFVHFKLILINELLLHIKFNIYIINKFYIIWNEKIYCLDKLIIFYLSNFLYNLASERNKVINFNKLRKIKLVRRV